MWSPRATILAEIETDKATMEMEAFDDGVLKEIYVPEGQKVSVGERIALIGGDQESPSAPVQKVDALPKRIVSPGEDSNPSSPSQTRSSTLTKQRASKKAIHKPCRRGQSRLLLKVAKGVARQSLSTSTQNSGYR